MLPHTLGVRISLIMFAEGMGLDGRRLRLMVGTKRVTSRKSLYRPTFS